LCALFFTVVNVALDSIYCISVKSQVLLPSHKNWNFFFSFIFFRSFLASIIASPHNSLYTLLWVNWYQFEFSFQYNFVAISFNYLFLFRGWWIFFCYNFFHTILLSKQNIDSKKKIKKSDTWIKKGFSSRGQIFFWIQNKRKIINFFLFSFLSSQMTAMMMEWENKKENNFLL
jgi:hypothetical protein